MEIDFESLREGLSAAVPYIERFCQKYNYLRAPSAEEGRYPRIRISKIISNAVRWIDFEMTLDANGNRFKTYSKDLSYELSGGAFADFTTEFGFTRYGKHFTLWDSTPLSLALPKLASSLICASKIFENWDVEYLKNEGQRVDICNGRGTIIVGEPRYIPTQLELADDVLGPRKTVANVVGLELAR